MIKEQKINRFYNEVLQLRQTIQIVKNDELEVKIKSIVICLENYTTRLEGYLLGTYNNQALDTKAILLRGCIEAYILANIFVHNEQAAKQFYNRSGLDLKYIRFKYGKAALKRYGSIQDEEIIVHKSDRFDYIGTENLYPNSLVELVDFALLDERQKLFLKYWIKVCDDTVHPRFQPFDLKLDIQEAIFGDVGIICQLQKLVFELVSGIFGSIMNWEEEREISDAIVPILSVMNQEVYEIQDLLVRSNKPVLMVLFNEFVLNYLDLQWAIQNRRRYLFYIKVRFILEFVGVFFILLKHPIRIDLYKLQGNLLSKDLVEYLVKYEPNNKAVKTYEKTYLLNYESSYHQLKAFFQLNYPQLDLVKLKHSIKQTNGWAIGVLNHKEKAPKTIDLINYSIKQLVDEELVDYLNGIYVESCEYCHISAFSALEIDPSFELNRFILKTVLDRLFGIIKMNLTE